MTRKTTSRILIIFACIIATCIFFLVSETMRSQKVRVTIPIVKQNVGKNKRILESNIGYMPVDPESITANMVTNPKDIINMYSLRDLEPNEHFYKNWIAQDVQKSLAEKAIYGAVSVPMDMIRSVNSEIKEDDFVLLSIITGIEKDADGQPKTFNGETTTDGLPSGSVSLIEPPELSAVRVLGLVDKSGLDINDKRDSMLLPDGSVDLTTDLPQGTILMLDCDDVQRAFILQAQYSGTIHATILPEAEQQYHRELWGLVDRKAESDESVKDVNGDIKLGSKDKVSENTTQLSDVDATKRREELLEMSNKKAEENKEKLHTEELASEVTQEVKTEQASQPLQVEVKPE